MLYTLLTPAASDGASESSTTIDSSNPMDNSSVLGSDSTTTSEGSSSTSTSTDNTTPVGCFSTTEQTIKTLVGWGLIIALLMWFYFSNKKRMKQQQEYIDRRNNIKPGNKVMTIGGITGTVVEVNPDDNTFVLETGSEEMGKSYLRFDKAAIHDSDAIAQEPVETPVEEVPVETPAQDAEADELFDEANKPEPEETAEEAPATEAEETEEVKDEE